MHVMKMCQAFQQEGHTPVLFARRPPPDETFDPESIWHHYGVQVRFPIRYVKPPYRVFLPLALKSYLDMRRGQSILVYARLVNAPLWFSVLGIPTICEMHGGEGIHINRLGFILRGTGFRKLVVITTPAREMYRQRFVDLLEPEHFIIAPDGVDVERFEKAPDKQTARQHIGVAEQRFIAGYAGHLYPGRGVDLILDLAERMPETLFLIVGGRDEDRDHWRKYTQEQGLTNARIIGFVPNAELPTYLAACDAVLMPYQRKVIVAGAGQLDTATWMSPLKMFEYMATRRLIISSDLPVLREILNDDNAVLCDPEDRKAWQQALMRASNEPAWAAQKTACAWHDVQQYSWRQRVRRIMASLEEGV